MSQDSNFNSEATSAVLDTNSEASSSTRSNPALDEAIVEALSHLRDTSVRDGVQSWDGNKWKIDDIIPVVQEIDNLAVLVDKLKITGKNGVPIKLPPIEAWGGGQVLQPGLYLGENPIRNLEKLNKAAPHLDLQCLYRGRQGFGFAPISKELQEAAINTAADKGIKVFRIFDMMNDLDNMETGIEIVKKYKEQHPNAGVKLEGAVAYISEPQGLPDKDRAWTLQEYANMAVDLAKKGCDEIAIKNFSGTGYYEMEELVKITREALDKEDFKDIKLNLHMHGERDRAELFTKCINAGADKVDVGIGGLSGGPAHTNMREMIYHLLKEKKFDVKKIDEHPIMQQLAKIEGRINEVVIRSGADGKSFDDKRNLLKELSKDEVKLEGYRMAAGALSDLTGRIQKDYAKKKGQWEQQGIAYPSETQLVERALEIGAELRNKAGRFNTVTPGAKILVSQVVGLAIAEVEGKKRNMTMYNNSLIDIAIGRYGRNQGMEKGIGDTNWRDALLMFRALNVLSDDKLFLAHERRNFMKALGLPHMLNGNKINIAHEGLEEALMKIGIKKFEEVLDGQNLEVRLPIDRLAATLHALNDDKKFLVHERRQFMREMGLVHLMDGNKIKFTNEDLNHALPNLKLGKLDQFIQDNNLDARPAAMKRLRASLKTGRSPEPANRESDGKGIIDALIAEIKKKHPIYAPLPVPDLGSDANLLAVLLRDPSAGNDQDAAMANIIKCAYPPIQELENNGGQLVAGQYVPASNNGVAQPTSWHQYSDLSERGWEEYVSKPQSSGTGRA